MSSALGVSPAAWVPEAPSTGTRYAGLATRLIAFAMDALVIVLVAAIVAAGAAVVGSLFRFPRNLHTLWVVLGVTAYVLWAVGYFVVFWSTTGQTPGARVMQIRVVTAAGGALKPARSLVRAIGLILAALPLFLGFTPILFDSRRRALPDFLARTVVVSEPQLSVAQVQSNRLRAAAKPRVPA